MTRPDKAPSLRVLQITDPHLMARAEGALLGVNTRDSLSAVIGEARRHHGQPDLILATGDLAQDGSEAAYRVFGDSLACFGSDMAWLAGNHDDTATLARTAAHYGADRRQLVRGGWNIVLLDSSVAGQVHGELVARELTFLDTALAAEPQRPALVALHHHPVDIGSGWMDRIGLRNREAFWAVIDRHPQVRVVLWGHVHQAFDGERNGVRLLATPSTCIQFARGSREFAVEPLAPGYRWLELAPDGGLVTEVRRADGFRFELDQNSSGY
ncbi:3',5'-cyclic-AMP phosphodiesterase [Marinobacter lutaoensis]|jgi:Icc protein|uniref:3',5'-cyclic-AMP phosphodiesterase n=1 Tax=Marinobacter lutaoensis TaxID=135739 RepID=A0A1V2DVG0_9GAMM|nr:3',5'-cyclic-AMP phosphodiesterase [Marinobacter lutaoensis]MBE02640.1 3',5'-cyclic-AMP phosphodiesterase [Marinobacter sp.]MBI44076.1 3',5'-cyclic-AMP phosphodiesterase [Oceanospirillales bacterium]ONF44672.1 3',5'-cyclic-AMP phosphodiesterase [Marinobacter lutaoensis]